MVTRVSERAAGERLERGGPESPDGVVVEVAAVRENLRRAWCRLQERLPSCRHRRFIELCVVRKG